MDSHLIMEEVNKQLKADFKPWWVEVLKTFNWKDPQQAEYAALLYYIAPFLQRWRGIQLPVELVCGEAGSGKSSMFMLRLNILTGVPALRNLPTDIKDWYASIKNVGGLHVIDNVAFKDRQLQQKMSDEICRLVTEPVPTVEMRKYYTNDQQVKIPINTTFGMTAIAQPFQNSDLIQRAAIFFLEPRDGVPDGDWVPRMLEEYGGREAWVAHHVVFLHRWLKAATSDWEDMFKTVHRLAHLEQALHIAGKVCGVETNWLAGQLMTVMENSLIDADRTFEGLKAYAMWRVRNKKFPASEFTVKDITDWAETNPDYEKYEPMINTYKLGRYMGTHAAQIKRIIGIWCFKTVMNKRVYTLTDEGILKAKRWAEYPIEAMQEKVMLHDPKIVKRDLKKK
jgi:hypothetical protein